MKKAKAIELLKLAVPVKALTQQEYSDFVEAVNMGIDALEQPTTSDTISRQAALDIFDDYNVSVEYGELEAYSRDRKRLCELPTIQPEPPIIKCKDYKWWRKQKDSAQGRCRLLGIYPTGAWYCGNAERRTE